MAQTDGQMDRRTDSLIAYAALHYIARQKNRLKVDECTIISLAHAFFIATQCNKVELLTFRSSAAATCLDVVGIKFYWRSITLSSDERILKIGYDLTELLL